MTADDCTNFTVREKTSNVAEEESVVVGYLISILKPSPMTSPVKSTASYRSIEILVGVNPKSASFLLRHRRSDNFLYKKTDIMHLDTPIKYLITRTQREILFYITFLKMAPTMPPSQVPLRFTPLLLSADGVMSYLHYMYYI